MMPGYMRDIACYLQPAALLVCALSYSGICRGAVLRGCGDVELQQYCYSSYSDGTFLRSYAVGHRVLPELGVSCTAF